MAKTFCIPKQLAQQLKQGAQRGEINIGKMYEMTSAQRRGVFEKYTDKPTAQEINIGFEKAMASLREDALLKWAKRTFNAESKKNGMYKGAVEKINKLKEEGLLTPEKQEAFLEDLVAQRLGVSITSEEASVIIEKAKKLEELAGKTSSIGLPTTEYFKARSDIEKYLQGRIPGSRVRIATSTIGRGMMLASVKSPIVNIESNTVQAILTAFERRISSGTYTGLNSAYARKFAKENFKIYQASGYDTSRMISFDDGKKILGEEITHSQGKGAVRFLGRVAEDVIFKQMMGAPDVAFSSMHFADSANLASSKIARSEGLKGAQLKERALEIFKDAVKIDPETIEGELVRSQAIADAQYATYTNESRYSNTALLLRSALNKVSGDLRVGDNVMPFVKTPANVVGAGIDFSGAGLPLQVYLLPKAIKQLRAGDSVAFRRSVTSIVRSGLGLTFAFVLSQLFDPDDFIGNWPVSEKERKLLEEQNATSNSVKISGKWVSLDYFSSLSAPLIGMMYARKYGHTPTEKIIKYYQGVGEQALKIPGFRDFQDIVKDVQDFTDSKKTGQKELTTTITNSVLNYIRSRSVPAIVSDIAKATDDVERKADIKRDPLARIKSAIPGLRQTLPEKTTVFGDTVKAESALSTILFGSRVKTAIDNTLIQELVRLDEAGQLPSITDLAENSPRSKELRDKIGEEQYNAFRKDFQSAFKTETLKLIEKRSYKRKDDEEKKKAIDKIKNDQFDKYLKKYGYKKKK